VAVGPLLGGTIASHGHGVSGYRAAFFVCGAVCFAVALAARVVLAPIPTGVRPVVSLPRRPRAVPGMRMWPPLVLASLGQLVRGGLMYTVIPLVGTRHLGLDTGGVGAALSVMALVDLAAMRYGGQLADDIGRRKVLGIALASGCAVAASAPAVHGPVAFGLWCAALGVVVGVTWVVPVAVVVDVAAVAEDGLTAYRIGADVGQLAGSTGAGAIVSLVGTLGATLSFGAAFAGLAVWVTRLPETASRRRAAPASAPADPVAPRA